MRNLTHPSNWPIVDNNGNSKVAQAVIFGLGSMFNHSTQEQNVGWMRDTQRQIITYRALRDIPAGEELCK
jgi:SET domain-containing protein